MAPKQTTDAVHWFMSELTSRVVAQSGLPRDRFHLGKLILQSLKDYPDAVMQIDGATGETETNASLMERTIKCATAFRNLGLIPGDVMALMAPNHVDLAVPFYAGLFTGVIVAAVDRSLGVKELQDTFNVIRPKIIFCQSEKAPDVQVALNEIDLNALIITFDKGDYLCNLADFITKYADDTPIEEFQPTDFDPEETTGFLISTSGTTGLPKAAEVTHKNFAISIPMFWLRCTTFPSPIRMALVGAPLQWLTALFHYIASPIFKYIRLQTSLTLTQEHAYYLINTYKPTYTIFSPTLMATLIKKEERDQCDFTCFEVIMLAGSAVPITLIDDIQSITPSTEVINVFGMSELAGMGFNADFPPPGSCGKPLGCFQYRIINVDTQEEIVEPNVPGELWLKGPAIFKGYYDNVEATEDAFENGWFKTGDMFYRDENWNYFFVERIKLLLKYKSYQISPVEVENVIRQHPGVLDVAVTGIPDPESGDLPVACVVTRDGYEVSVDEIKDLEIDAATGEEETYASVASRSIQLARALREFGLRPGDVLALGGKNHLDLHIPFYAALYNGLPIVGVDPFFKYDEVRTLFKLTKPKIAFCQYESFDTYVKAAADLGLDDMKIVTFEHGKCTMAHFMDEYDTGEPEGDFRVTDFDTDKIYAFLVSTSGTTGKVKVVAFNHKPFIYKIKALLKLYNYDKQPKKKVLNLSPVNWISNYFMSIGGPLIGDTKLQSSIPDDYEHIIYIINKYKPVTCLMGPTFVTYLVSQKEEVDFSSFKSITITGSKIFPELLAKFKALLSKDTLVVEAYGQTETIGSVLGPVPNGPSGSCGKPLPFYAIKLVDPNTGLEIKEPYVTGELWNKGPRFTEYYNDPEETVLAFSEDGYFKTGDLLYRDENDYYFYVDRLKTLIKYRNSHILPLEVEEQISTHPGVKEVCVVGISDPLEGQKAVACIVRNEGSHVTALDIKNLVASKLSKNKQLRGGVVFVDRLPLTSSGKLARSKVLQLVSSMKRE